MGLPREKEDDDFKDDDGYPMPGIDEDKSDKIAFKVSMILLSIAVLVLGGAVWIEAFETTSYFPKFGE